jgi:hypothetical protein
MRLARIHLALLAILFIATSTSPSGVNLLRSYDRDHLLTKDAFTIVLSTDQLPEPVRVAFARICHDSAFSMANPNEDFQATDVILEPGLQWRRLIFAAVANDHVLIHYELGGVALARQVVLFRVSGPTVTFVWGAYCGERLATIDELRSLIRARKYREAHVW